MGPQQDETLHTTFEHIMHSSQLSSQPQPQLQQTAEHYVWRQAHILRLQVPNYLQPPRHSTYVSQDSSLRLKASLYNPNDSSADSSLEVEAANDLRFGGTPGSSSKEYKNSLTIQQIDYVFQG